MCISYRTRKSMKVVSHPNLLINDQYKDYRQERSTTTLQQLSVVLLSEVLDWASCHYPYIIIIWLMIDCLYKMRMRMPAHGSLCIWQRSTLSCSLLSRLATNCDQPSLASSIVILLSVWVLWEWPLPPPHQTQSTWRYFQLNNRISLISTSKDN